MPDVGPNTLQLQSVHYWRAVKLDKLDTALYFVVIGWREVKQEAVKRWNWKIKQFVLSIENYFSIYAMWHCGWLSVHIIFCLLVHIHHIHHTHHTFSTQQMYGVWRIECHDNRDSIKVPSHGARNVFAASVVPAASEICVA